MRETGMKDSEGVMILEGDKVYYGESKKEFKVAFKNYSWVLLDGKTLHTYFKDIRKKITIIGRGL